MKNALLFITGTAIGAAGFFGGKRLIARKNLKLDLAVAHLRAELEKCSV